MHHKVWGGPFEGNPIPDEIFYELYHIYLDPLRDYGRFLRPGRNNLLGKFFSKVKSDEYNKEELIQDLNQKIDNHNIIKFVESSKESYIDSHLDGMTHDDFPHFDINIIPEEFDEFVQNFFITLPIDGGNLELSQNGLGYNNLIYMSILLGNLNDWDNDYLYAALCVEEPEAHLHPQLQKLFFEYLVNNLNKDYPFQIFMTSHSPILVSHADLDSLIILEKLNNEIKSVRWIDLNLDEKDREFLKKFLDANKISMLFSKKVILVEGASERILLPFFGKIKGYSFENKNIELIETGGNQNIIHYSKAFLNSDEKDFLRKKCAILTDNDKDNVDDEGDDLALNLMNNFNGGNIGVFISEKDLEFEIVNSNKNNVALLRYLLMDKTIVSSISRTDEFLKSLDDESYDENLIYDYINDIKFKKTNLPMKIIMEWDDLENFKIPAVIDELFEFLED